MLNIANDLHKAIYLLPLYTGMRRNEIRLLEWEDLTLSGSNPSVFMRASTTKNAKDKIAPLSDDAVKALSAIKPENATGRVFPDFPRFREMQIDWERANIPVIDKNGLRADFHSLRKTFCTLLYKAGVSQRVAQEAMRHSEARLTNQVYTDASQLNTRDAIKLLPSFLGNEKQKCPPICPPNLVKSCHSLSQIVTQKENDEILQVVDVGKISPNLSISVSVKKMVHH